MINTQNISKNLFIQPTTDNSFLWLPLGCEALTRLEQEYFTLCKSINIATVKLADYNNTTYLKCFEESVKTGPKPYKQLPCGYQSAILDSEDPVFKNSLNWAPLVMFSQEDFTQSFQEYCLKILKWLEKIGFKLSEIIINQEFQKISEQFLTTSVDTSQKDFLQVELSLGSALMSFTLAQRQELPFKAQYLNTEGVRTDAIVVKFTIVPSLDRFLAELLVNSSFMLPALLNPTPCVVLSVSEKWEDLAKIVAKKLNAKADCSADAVGKKIRYWKSLGTAEIYVVGEKDMQELTTTGQITLMKNSLDGKIEPVVLKML